MLIGDVGLCRDPFVKGLVLLQASTGDEQFADYKPKTAFLFPGQGAQTVGMAAVGPPQISAGPLPKHCGCDLP